VRVLVTGGAGFIGSNFVRMLVADALPGLAGADVAVLDKLTYAGSLTNLATVLDTPRMRFVQGDVLDGALLDDLLPGVDAVVHLAAESHVDRSIAGPADAVLTNVVGSRSVLDAARRAGTRRVVQVSTDEVYGSVDTGVSREDDALRPSTPYAASKASADLLALSYARTYGLDVVVTRGSNTYGPHQYPEKIVPLFLTRLLDGGTVPLYGDGLNERSWLHVDDHCRGIALALTRGRPGEVYNLGGGTPLTNLELTRRLVAATGRDESAVVRVADRLGHDRRYALDRAKASAALGYAPSVPFEDGLAATVEWYREHRAWWAPLRGVRGGH
jgi:dTDP-glucose 4,6-dehydratase